FGGFGGFGDIFGDIFGFGGGTRSNPNAPRKGESLRATLNISFEEAAFGCKKEVTVGRVEQCADCKGTGCAPGTTPEICPDCKGTGSVTVSQRTPFGVMQSSSPCSKCRGTGKIIHQPCKTCRGMGSIRRQHKIEINVPAGIDDGQTISKPGAGNAGANGGPAGDLLVTVMVKPHPRFERDGTSVLLEQEISYAQAVLGAEVEVPTLDGKVKLTIPEGTQPGAVFRLRGKGIPYLRGSGRGDQFVSVTVKVPRNLTGSQKELLRQFAASMGELDGEAGRSIFGRKKK
ncbi:MAG: molecular chaperone DnaJ, partial [Oscillospiraceae bacterium]|nr:molecular chaperone DnaJ [Oscillospiraceae bacterium]